MKKESQQYYIKLIHELFPSLRYYQADDVNEEAADVIDRVLAEIERVCRPIAMFQAVLKNLTPLLWQRTPRDITGALFDLCMELINLLRSTPRYRFIVDAAAVKNRSVLEVALMGL